MRQMEDQKAQGQELLGKITNAFRAADAAGFYIKPDQCDNHTGWKLVSQGNGSIMINCTPDDIIAFCEAKVEGRVEWGDTMMDWTVAPKS
jgi:hypothetical protein